MTSNMTQQKQWESPAVTVYGRVEELTAADCTAKDFTGDDGHTLGEGSDATTLGCYS